MVIGYRYRRADPWHRCFNAWAWNRLIRFMLGVRVRDLDCAFKLFRREVVERLQPDRGRGRHQRRDPGPVCPRRRADVRDPGHPLPALPRARRPGRRSASSCGPSASCRSCGSTANWHMLLLPPAPQLANGGRRPLCPEAAVASAAGRTTGVTWVIRRPWSADGGGLSPWRRQSRPPRCPPGEPRMPACACWPPARSRPTTGRPGSIREMAEAVCRAGPRGPHRHLPHRRGHPASAGRAVHRIPPLTSESAVVVGPTSRRPLYDLQMVFKTLAGDPLRTGPT